MAQIFNGDVSAPRVLLIDNYDSFSFNLVQGFAELGASLHVYRNDELTTEHADDIQPSHLVISPGPGRPENAGMSLALINHFAGKLPLLGVCLGHQCIVSHYGGEIVSAPRLMHGKMSAIRHDGKTLFENINNPMDVGRYHSLCANADELPKSLYASAASDQGELMAVRHRELPVEGVQFHPESVLTPDGLKLMKNFLDCQR